MTQNTNQEMIKRYSYKGNLKQFQFMARPYLGFRQSINSKWRYKFGIVEMVAYSRLEVLSRCKALNLEIKPRSIKQVEKENFSIDICRPEPNQYWSRKGGLQTLSMNIKKK